MLIVLPLQLLYVVKYDSQPNGERSGQDQMPLPGYLSECNGPTLNEKYGTSTVYALSNKGIVVVIPRCN
jgi:hypothetical protein